MTLKNMAYDNAAYIARGQFTAVIAVGASTAGTKFTAFANLLLLGLTINPTAAGTSTYSTGLANNVPAATVAVASQQYSVIRITNTATSGATVALSTSTFGPFTLGGNFVASGTATNQVGAFSQFQIAGNGTSTSSNGGVAVNAGDTVYVVSGTDATAAGLHTIDFQVAPLANVVG